jgi:hypothetical protein
MRWTNLGHESDPCIRDCHTLFPLVFHDPDEEQFKGDTQDYNLWSDMSLLVLNQSLHGIALTPSPTKPEYPSYKKNVRDWNPVIKFT